MTDEGFALSFSCDENIQKQEFTCGVSVSDDVHSSHYTATTVWAMTEVEWLNATITAGVEKLSATGAS